MSAEIKFCGLTRPPDAVCAAELGADYLGVIFAESPRQQTPASALKIFEAASGIGRERAARRVGVFGSAPASRVLQIARDVPLDVVQLHGDPSPETVGGVRADFEGEIWAVIRLASEIPENASELIGAADGIVLDRLDVHALGGTGATFDWRIAEEWLRGQRSGKLILAGGLRPANVGDAITALRPDVVDVSSGVESSLGQKDHGLMREFARAVAAADPR